MLELGAGTGMVSLVAARCGAAAVLATDGDEAVCETLRENVESNGLAGCVRVERRRWGGAREVPERVDVVVGADVVGSPPPRRRDGGGANGWGWMG